MQNGLYGLLDQNLKEIIPLKYDQISPFNFNWNHLNVSNGFKLFGPTKSETQEIYRVTSGKETGLLKADNSFLIKPREAIYYQDTENFIIMVEEMDDEEYSSYINIHGSFLFHRIKGKLRPFGNGTISFACDTYNRSPDYVIGNVRVINRQGKFINNKTYKRAMICDQNQISIQTESGKIGMMDFQGNLVIKSEYKLQRLNTDAYVPEDMLNVIGENFYFSSQGLRLVFATGDNRSHMINTVTIPWSRFHTNENCTLIRSVFKQSDQ